MVRSRVFCDTLTENTIRFSVVHDPNAAADDPDNVRFTRSFPSGTIQLSIDNPEARDQFEAGKEYYMDFSPCDETNSANEFDEGSPAIEPEPKSK